MESLKKYIQLILPMPNEKVEEVIKDFSLIELKQNTFLLEENKISTNTHFLQSGYIRTYILDVDGNQITTNIFSAPCFVSDFLSLFKQQPAKENFQTLTECSLYQMSFEKLQLNFHSIPEFREFGRMMLVTNYSTLQERMLGMIKDTAETRYINLMNKHPNIFQNVPLKIIASYLGITDTSLSRIRKEITNK